MLARQHWITAAIALSGTLACAGLGWLQWNIIHMQRELAIQDEIRNRWEAIRFEIKRAEDLQDTVVAFLEATENVRREQFEAFAAGLPPVNFQAISFAAYVPRANRAEFERQLGADKKPASAIWELDAESKARPVADREAYFPVTYLYPGSGNSAAIGFDLMSEPRRRRALLAAIETGKTVRTDPVRLVQAPTSWAFLVFKPVYARQMHGTAAVERTRPQLVGVVSAVYQFGSLMQTAIRQPGNSEQAFALFDAAEPAGPVYAYYSAMSRSRDLQGPMTLVAARPGARVVTAVSMQHTLSAVFFSDDGTTTWWKEINAAILATLIIGLVLTAALVRDHVRGYRLAIQLAKARDEGRARKEEAERASAAKSRVLAYASHDLRQPLHALELFVAHLKQEPLAYPTAKIVGNIDSCVTALGELLAGLLNLARLDSGSIQPIVEPVSVSALWTRLQHEFAQSAKERNLDLRFRPSPLWLRSDPQLLHRILLNLVSNAIRYTDKGGVLVACRRRGNTARVQVWDTGVGIAPQDAQDVFEEFVQLDNPEGNRIKGLGLGLSIVERTARLLDHRLAMRSVPGRGSCFSLDIPIADQHASRLERDEALHAGDRDSFAGSTVLVIEDDVLSRRAIVELMQSWRCRVVSVGSAEDALAALSAGCVPDLIVSDVRLPNHQSGIELVARARAVLGHDVAAFVISGDTSAEVTAAAKAATLLLLHKPVKAPRLRLVIRQLLVRQEQSTAGAEPLPLPPAARIR